MMSSNPNNKPKLYFQIYDAAYFVRLHQPDNLTTTWEQIDFTTSPPTTTITVTTTATTTTTEAPRVEVKGLLEQIYIEEYDSHHGDVCGICLNEMKIGDEASVMDCSHMFFFECLYPWLKIKSTCPLCRYEMTSPPRINVKSKRKRCSVVVHEDFKIIRSLL